MEKSYYSAATLEDMLLSFEERHGLASEDFFARHLADEPLEGISGFHRHAWASFYRDFRRLSGAPFTENVKRLLAQPA